MNDAPCTALPGGQVLAIVASAQRVESSGAVPRVALYDSALLHMADRALHLPAIRSDIPNTVHCCTGWDGQQAGLKMPQPTDLHQLRLQDMLGISEAGKHELWKDLVAKLHQLAVTAGKTMNSALQLGR